MTYIFTILRTPHWFQNVDCTLSSLWNVHCGHWSKLHLIFHPIGRGKTGHFVFSEKKAVFIDHVSRIHSIVPLTLRAFLMAKSGQKWLSKSISQFWKINNLIQRSWGRKNDRLRFQNQRTTLAAYNYQKTGTIFQLGNVSQSMYRPQNIILNALFFKIGCSTSRPFLVMFGRHRGHKWHFQFWTDSGDVI